MFSRIRFFARRAATLAACPRRQTATLRRLASGVAILRIRLIRALTIGSVMVPDGRANAARCQGLRDGGNGGGMAAMDTEADHAALAAAVLGRSEPAAAPWGERDDDRARRCAAKPSGRPPGPRPIGYRHLKAAYDPAEVIQHAADSLLAGKGLPLIRDHSHAPISQPDRLVIQRTLGMEPEAFRGAVLDQYRTVLAKCMSRVEEALDDGTYKPGELSYLLAVTTEKMRLLDGSATLQNSSINVQVNNYNGVARSRDQIIAGLIGDEALKEVDAPSFG